MCLLWEQNIKLNFDRPHITILIRCIRMCPWRSHWQSHTIGNLLTTCVALVHSNSLVCQIPFTVLDFEVHWICQSICNLHCVHIDVVALNRNLISLSIFIQFTWCRPVFISECIEICFHTINYIPLKDPLTIHTMIRCYVTELNCVNWLLTKRIGTIGPRNCHSSVEYGVAVIIFHHIVLV